MVDVRMLRWGSVVCIKQEVKLILQMSFAGQKVHKSQPQKLKV